MPHTQIGVSKVDRTTLVFVTSGVVVLNGIHIIERHKIPCIRHAFTTEPTLLLPTLKLSIQILELDGPVVLLHSLAVNIVPVGVSNAVGSDSEVVTVITNDGLKNNPQDRDGGRVPVHAHWEERYLPSMTFDIDIEQYPYQFSYLSEPSFKTAKNVLGIAQIASRLVAVDGFILLSGSFGSGIFAVFLEKKLVGIIDNIGREGHAFSIPSTGCAVLRFSSRLCCPAHPRPHQSSF